VCDFLLVVNSNLGHILYCFPQKLHKTAFLPTPVSLKGFLRTDHLLGTAALNLLTKATVVRLITDGGNCMLLRLSVLTLLAKTPKNLRVKAPSRGDRCKFRQCLYSEKKFEDMFSYFDSIPACDRRTDILRQHHRGVKIMNTTLTSNFGHIVAKYGLDNYRAMLCIARTMLSQMSVCPSVTRRYCAETAKCILKLFAASGSHTYLVFSAPNIMAIFRRGPLIHGGYEKSRFPIKISLYRSFYSCNSAYVCASKPTHNLFRCCSGEHF